MALVNSSEVLLQWGCRIALRDGVELNSVIYMPAADRAPSACIVAMTPYTVDHCHGRAKYFAQQGFVFIVVDVRGRGDSEGKFLPFIQEGRDAFDVIEWIAGQAFCNGKVAMWGGSYLGYCQWAAIKELPPHLTTIVPIAAPYVGVDFPMRNNIFNPYVVRWLTFVSGKASQSSTFADADFWLSVYERWVCSGRPFRDLDAISGNASEIFQEWLNHPESGEFWDQFNPTKEQYARLEIPTLTITGAYDSDQPGALKHYTELMSKSGQMMREKHFLVIGPWDHAGLAMPGAEVGGLKIGRAGLVDLQELQAAWYSWRMLDGPQPQFLEKTVAYYVTGSERWRYTDTLESATAHHEVYFLSSYGRADDVFASGSLQPSHCEGKPDVYSFDPCHDCQGSTKRSGDPDDSLVVDQGGVSVKEGKLLIYHSAPFLEDKEITGFFEFLAWLSIDCPDTDFYVSVHEITLDGRCIRLSSDLKRARYREGSFTSKLVSALDPLQYNFDSFTFVSRKIRRGHRLQLVLAPTPSAAGWDFAQTNFNAGGVVATEDTSCGRRVTVKLFHDATHASVLYVPIGLPDMEAEA